MTTKRRLVGAALGLMLIVPACATSEVSDPVPTIPPIATTATTATPPNSSSTTSDASQPTPTTSVTSTTTAVAPLAPLTGFEVDLIAEVHRPVVAVPVPGTPGLLVVDQQGRIVAVDENGTVADFLDLTDRVGANGIEQGLLGLALHPDFASNGRFFVYYTAPDNDSHLVEFGLTADGLGDRDSAREVMFFEQPTDRHNAGTIVFGPDGYLWLSLGEGGAASENAQNPETLLSSLLRLDVDGIDPYGIPTDNPFVDGGGAPEVWAFGLRNPWKFSIDPVDRMIYIGDVGHSDWEEIDVVSMDTGGGSNFGWLPMEGTHCFISGCDPDLYTLPIVEYSHEGGNCSVTGGVVYRGKAIPEFDGHYFYADWCGGWIRSFKLVDGEATEMTDWSEQLGNVGQVTSFGTDGDGELLFTTWDGGVYRLAPVRG